MGGTAYDSRRATDSYKDFLSSGAEQKKDTLKWEVDGIHHLEAADGAPEWFSATPGTVSSGRVEIHASIGQRKQSTIDLENDVMTYEDFYAQLTPDSSDAFDISPIAGTLERRGEGKFMLTVGFTGTGEAHTGTLVVQTEESKWTYDLTGTSG